MVERRWWKQRLARDQQRCPWRELHRLCLSNDGMGCPLDRALADNIYFSGFPNPGEGFRAAVAVLPPHAGCCLSGL